MADTNNASPFIAAIRLRGTVRVTPDIQKTLDSLKLKAKYNMILISYSSTIERMLQRAKDYVTWGEIDQETIAQLFKLRGYTTGHKRLNNEFLMQVFPQCTSIDELASAISNGELPLRQLWQKGIRPIFRLHPPKRGFKGSSKRSYKDRGELGYRGTTIQQLLRKMM